MKGVWSFYINRKFNGGRMVMLRRWAVLRRENGHVTEVASLMEGELSCYRGGHCKGRRIVMLQFNGGKMMLQRWVV